MNTKQQDVLRRFLFEDLGVRGLWVRLSNSWQIAQQNQQSPLDVQLQLGQALSAVVLLSSTIKFKGSLILQVQGDGPVKTLVAQATHDRKIRGLVRSHGDIQLDSLQSIFGEGRLVITVSSETAKPYQGVVPILGKDLATALESYFLQSEQLNTRLWLFADSQQATGLMLQELPAQLSDKADWERIEMLADTLTEQEIQSLDCEEMLYRLFNEEKVRLYDEEAVEFDCSCSRLKIENTLRFLGRDELESVLVEQGQIEVNCEFCNKQYRFDRIDVEQLLRSDLAATGDPLKRH
ncbi:MAG: Hsp33 family molecular chaperone HslO [Methylococcaceae bacterium]|nr:Hsp33 family molecular chaperone HslO [Methylococcaceae bacterium]